MKNMNMKTTKWHRVSKLLILLLLLAAAVFYRDSLYEIFQGIRQTKPTGIWISILLSMAAYCMEGMTIACMAGAVIPVLRSIRQNAPVTRFAGFSVKKGITIAFLCEFYRMITLGSGSGFAEIYYLHKGGMETGSATGLTMIQYMLKRIAVMLLGVGGFAVLYGSGRGRDICRKYAGFMGAGCVVAIGVIVVFMGLALSERISGWTGRLLDWLSQKLHSQAERFEKWKEQATLLNHAGKLFLRKKRKTLCALGLQCGKMLIFYSIPAILLYGNVDLNIGESILLMAVAYMLSGIIPAPSGVGALEFVFLLFFTGFVEEGTAMPAILLFRFATWVLPFAVGGVALLFCRKKESF